MASQHQSSVLASDLRWAYFRWAAGVALVIWATLWLLGSIKYGPVATVGFVLASLGSIWLGAWMRAERVAGTASRPDIDSGVEESKKAA